MLSEKNELVSIIMPAFNASATIYSSIKSVLFQDYRNWELLIADDSSQDGTTDIVEMFADERIRLIRSPFAHSTGVAATRNRAIAKATGRYIAFLDADDCWLPDKLSAQIDILSMPSILCSHSSYYILKSPQNSLSLVRSMEVVTYEDMKFGNRIGNLTGIYDSKILGKFYQKNIGHEDYEMWLRVFAKCGFSVSVQQPKAVYRKASQSLSADKFRSALWSAKIVWRVSKNNPIAFVPRFMVYVLSSVFKHWR